MSTREWLEVQEAMTDVAPYYDRVNSLITFGLAETWRKHIASLARPDDEVLEIGSGPGTFAKHLQCRSVYCLEPLGELATSSRSCLDSEQACVLRGVGENIPLADERVDKVFCVFSFRDFFNRSASVSEIRRVLREGGELFIADVARPPPGPFSKLLELHVRHVVPILARVAVPPETRVRWSRDPYRTFVETYEAFGFTDVYEDLMRRTGFSDVRTEYLELKGATITRGTKPWRSTS